MAHTRFGDLLSDRIKSFLCASFNTHTEIESKKIH